VLSGAHETALADSQITFQSSKRAGSINKYVEALAKITGVSGRYAYGFRTELHVVDVSLLPQL
jgi:hypothetical protein